jgi:hypothetical protein
MIVRDHRRMTTWQSLLYCAAADVTLDRIKDLVAVTGTEPLTVDFKEGGAGDQDQSAYLTAPGIRPGEGPHLLGACPDARFHLASEAR